LNNVDTGPHQDHVAMITKAVRKVGLRMGLYHSLMEWFNPLYDEDLANNGTTRLYATQVLQPMLHEMVNQYKPDLVWVDGDRDLPDTYWGSKEFLAWLYNDSPVSKEVIVNDRWGTGDACHHGGYWTCYDDYNPGHLVPRKFENALPLDKAQSWGYRRNAKLADYLSVEDIIEELVSTVSCGGNMLLNVGPTADGVILPVFEERLRQLGSWLQVNGEAIYKSIPWRVQNDTAAQDIWYTQGRSGEVYAIFRNWPVNNELLLTHPMELDGAIFQMLGLNQSLSYYAEPNQGISIDLPVLTPGQLPCQWQWTIKIAGVK